MTDDSRQALEYEPLPPAAPMLVNVRLGAMMFLQFFIWGSWYVSTGLYMEVAGPEMVARIGDAYSVGPIAAILSPLFLGLIADRFFASERVLGTMHLLGGLAMLMAPQTAGWWFIGVLLLHMLCFMPTLGLSNTVAFHHIVNGQKVFPIIRVFGTLGWIAAGWLISLLALERSADQYYVTAAAAILLGFYSFTLPHTPPPLRGERVSIGSIFGLDALALLRRPSYLLFILASLLICIPLAMYYAFAGVFAGATGVFGDRVTLHMSFGQVSEVLFMLLLPLFFATLGVKWVLVVGMGAWAVRYGLFYEAADAGPGTAYLLILGGILLHGICYDFFFVAGQIYTDEQSGPKIRGQAQGLLVLVTQGVGMLIGAQLAQRLRANYSTFDEAGELVSTDWSAFWPIPAVMAAIVMVMFMIFFRHRRPPDAGGATIEAEVMDTSRGPGEAGLPPVDPGKPAPGH